MKTPELKSCPFCGGEAFFDRLYMGDDVRDCISCHFCNCTFTLSNYNPTKAHPTKTQLANEWNRRAGDENA